MNTFLEYKDALRNKVIKTVENKITFRERFSHSDIEEILLVVGDYSTEASIAEKICNSLLDNMDLVDIDAHNYEYIRELFTIKDNLESDKNNILDTETDDLKEVNEYLEKLGDY